MAEVQNVAVDVVDAVVTTYFDGGIEGVYCRMFAKFFKFFRFRRLFCEDSAEVPLTPIAPAVSTLSRRLPFSVVTGQGELIQNGGSGSKILAAVSQMLRYEEPPP